MADMDVVDLSPATLSEDEDRRRWAAEQAVKVACAYVAKDGPAGMSVMTYALDNIADALDAYAKDGTINRVPKTQG